MKKAATALVVLALLGVPAAAQVRPADCRPVLPVLDKAAQVLPQDVTTEQAAPVTAAAKRRFLGLPFLLPLLALAGGCAAACGGGGGGATPNVSPA